MVPLPRGLGGRYGAFIQCSSITPTVSKGRLLGQRGQLHHHHLLHHHDSSQIPSLPLSLSLCLLACVFACCAVCLPLLCSHLLVSNYSSILWSRHVVCPAIPRNASPLPPNRSPMRPPAIPAPASPQPHLSPRPPLCPPCLCTSPVSRHLQRAAPRRRHLRHQEQCRHELRGLQAE